jgi:hypothetical protein
VESVGRSCREAGGEQTVSTHKNDMKCLRDEYEAGKKESLAMAIFICAGQGKRLPAWAAEAWRDGWADVIMGLADWHDLLGKPKRKTDKKIERERKQVEDLNKLLELLPSIKASIDRDDGNGFFAELAQKMGVKPRQARELYYLKVKYHGEKIRVISRLALRSRRKVSKN